MSTIPATIGGKQFFVKIYDYTALAKSTQPCCLRPPETSRGCRPGTARCFTTASVRPERESLAPQTHYEMFPGTVPKGPPPRGPFVIDIRQLRKEFLQLQAKAHPDRHQGANKARAEGASARINEAYKTLQNPLLRAQYLLAIRGVNVAEEETAKIDNPELLMEVLETREEIEAAKDEDELRPLKERNDSRIEESEKALDAAFKADDIKTAEEEAVKLRYWINIKESLQAWEKGKPVVLVH
ncbi:hypothetical protein MMC30_003616 [Trapelia coarctata]|nr:hypothetical protein [Trapelia coarctata]